MKDFTCKTEPARRIAARLAVACLLLAPAVALAADAAPKTKGPAAQAGTKPEDFVITAAGDSIIMLPVTRDKNNPKFMGVVNAIRDGDAAFTNLEEVYPAETTPPGALSPNTYMAANPIVLKDLKWMGFNLFEASNNHAFDYGQQGLVDTIKALKDEGVTFAGIGKTLGEARAPAYLDTPRGRVALVATVSSVFEDATAGDPRPDRPGRPGANPLRFNTYYRVDQATFDSLAALRGKPGIVDPEGPQGGHQPGTWGEQLPHPPPPGVKTVRLAGRTYELSDKPGVYTTANQQDLDGIVRSIKDAKTRADYVVTGIHTHESGNYNIPEADENQVPPQFMEQFAHAAVDAGTDMFVGQGPHVLRGIEIYKGRPIFYSLGGLFFQNDLTISEPTEFYNRFQMGPDARPSEAFGLRDGYRQAEMYETVIARVAFNGGKPAEVTLTPVQLRRKAEGFPAYGVPELADAAKSAKILADLQRMSMRYGTVITIRNGKGYIAIPPAN